MIQNTQCVCECVCVCVCRSQTASGRVQRELDGKAAAVRFLCDGGFWGSSVSSGRETDLDSPHTET